MRWFVPILLLILLAGAALWMWQIPAATVYDSSMRRDVEVEKPIIGGSYSLLDVEGNLRTEQDFLGNYQIVYFGFTYCPDVCPTGLLRISRVMQMLGESGASVTPIFITVDPERDTPDQLKTYMTTFDPSIIALTGTEEQIKRATEAFKVYYARREDDTAAEYTMDHSAFTYLMDRDGMLITHFEHEATPEEIARTINQALAKEKALRGGEQ